MITNNNLSEQEVEQTAASRSVVEEVLTAIGQRREWANKYTIVKCAGHNPRTPLAISMRLIPKLSVRDLKDLGRDRNIAGRGALDSPPLYRIKQK